MSRFEACEVTGDLRCVECDGTEEHCLCDEEPCRGCEHGCGDCDRSRSYRGRGDREDFHADL